MAPHAQDSAVFAAPAAGRTRRRFRAGAGGIVERYLLRETLKPLGLALVVTLTALILERVLRLFDMIARGGGSFDAVARMAFNLVPHYLGLALPAAFFIALFIMVSRLDDGEELDALYAGGFSHWRLVRPFVAMGAVFAILSVLLFGYLQPYSRYAYREVAYAVRNGPWDARVEAGVVVDAGDGVVITADAVDSTGRNLTGVLLRRPRAAGEQVISAERGALRLTPDGRRLLLTVWNGQMQTFGADGAADQAGVFDELTVDRSFSAVIPPFRMRGEDERELTTREIRAALRGSNPTAVPDNVLASELHSRITRALTLPFLPMLAMTMGVAAKRRRRTAGIVAGAFILVLFQNLMQLGESLGDAGAVPAVIAVWTPFLVFVFFCSFVFAYSHAEPGRNAFTGLFWAIDVAGRRISRAARRLGRLLRGKAAAA